MIIHGVFTASELAWVRSLTGKGQCEDGRTSALGFARSVKDNQQYSFKAPESQSLADMTFTALRRSGTFFRFALPLEVSTPMINRYAEGKSYGLHYDSTLMPSPSGAEIRADLSATLFVSEPTDYDGGELCIQTASGDSRYKLAAGDMVVYPSCLLHQVLPVTRGAREAVVFWVQSRIRDHEQRDLLYRMDCAVGGLSGQLPESAEVRELVGVFQNLARMWV
jgi:PKHD-type hydroxylase